jgi:hypothetical protein
MGVLVRLGRQWREHDEQRRPDRHQAVGAQTGRAHAPLSLRADHQAARQGGQQAQQKHGKRSFGAAHAAAFNRECRRTSTNIHPQLAGGLPPFARPLTIAPAGSKLGSCDA